MSKPRVCFVVESGADVRLVEGLAERFDLHVLARRIEGGVEIRHPPAVEVDVDVETPSRTGFARAVFQRLSRAKGEFDFVLVQGYSIAAFAANLARRLTGTPTAMLICSPTEAYYRCRRTHPTPGKPYRERELAALRLFARLNRVVGERYLVLSEHLAEQVGGGRIDIVPLYGVDTERFRPTDEPRAELRRRLGLPETGSVMFFSSRIAPEKDAETLLAAFRELLDRGRDLWLLHRSGGYRGFLQDAERYGVAHRVIATDAVHPERDLPDDYRACDLCVQASREEGLGFSALEALASGVPVVAASVGGLRETVRDGETGWSYPVGDVPALAAAIEEVLDHPEEARRRAERGRALVKEKYERAAVFAALSRIVDGSRTSDNGSLSEVR